MFGIFEKKIEVEGLDVWITLMSHSTPISVLLMYYQYKGLVEI